MQQLMEQRSNINFRLNQALMKAKEYGIDSAKAEKAYRCRLRQEILIERTNKTPVTIMSDMVRGQEEVSELKLQRDIALTMYETAKESINVLKKQLSIVEGDIEALRRGV